MAEKKRDTYVDVLRGIAMLIVVFGHTLTGSTDHSEKSIIFNIIWSLQIPLFILISGYVTRYGRTPCSLKGLFSLLGKRTLAYLLPWLVFTVVLNGLILKKQELSLGALFWNMDSGYWFLITIWSVNIAYVIASFATKKICLGKKFSPLVLLAFYLCFMAVYALIGSFAGFSFLCIKLTLYYMPFYFVGYLFGIYKDTVLDRFPRLIQIVVALCTVIWVVAIIRLNLYYLEDSVPMVALRAMVSLCGCVSVCGLLRAVSPSGALYRFLKWIGSHTIEIYILHSYFLNLIMFGVKPEYLSARGAVLIAVNYLLTVGIISVITKLLDYNFYLSFVLFGKLPKNRLLRPKREE